MSNELVHRTQLTNAHVTAVPERVFISLWGRLLKDKRRNQTYYEKPERLK